jgi:hypothetical protein
MWREDIEGEQETWSMVLFAFGQWLCSGQIAFEKISNFYVSQNSKFCSIMTIVVHLFPT